MKNSNRVLREKIKQKMFSTDVPPENFDGKEKANLIDADYVLALLNEQEKELREIEIPEKYVELSAIHVFEWLLAQILGEEE